MIGSDYMKLIVGLGNPGRKYEHTRHNMGFDVVDLFSELAQIDVDKESFKGLVGRGKVFDEDVFILKPQTFMNLSGESIIEAINFYKRNNKYKSTRINNSNNRIINYLITYIFSFTITI